MGNNKTILYGQIPNYNQVIKDNVEIHPLLDTIISTLSEKLNGNIISFSEGKSKISFSQPENDILFVLSLTNRLLQSPKIPYKIGISYSDQTDSKNEKTAIIVSNTCPNGVVLVSKEVYDVLGNSPEFNFIHLGSSLFKGMDGPTDIYALAGKWFVHTYAK